MAQQVTIVLIDDIDKSDAAETVRFGLDGQSFEIDLSETNAAKLRDALAPFIAHARKAGGQRRRARGQGDGGASPAEVRAWARQHGFTVPDRGRIPAEVRDAYAAAH